MATGAQATTLASLGHARPLSRRPFAQWVAAHTRRGRLKRYARAMGWYLTTEGVLVGDVEGIAIRAYEDRKHIAVVELVAPAVLPRFEVRQREKNLPQIGDGMREVHTGDAHFDACYSLRAEEPWLIRAIVDASVSPVARGRARSVDHARWGTSWCRAEGPASTRSTCSPAVRRCARCCRPCPGRRTRTGARSRPRLRSTRSYANGRCVRSSRCPRWGVGPDRAGTLVPQAFSGSSATTVVAAVRRACHHS